MNEPDEEYYAIWTSSPPKDVGRMLDSLLASYPYYPPEEWGTYNYRPPESSDLLGSWRNRGGHVFIFLLTRYRDSDTKIGPDYEIMISGETEFVSVLGKQVISLKNELNKIEKRDIAGKNASKNLENEIKTKSWGQLTAAVVVFTAIVNALSFYIRKLPEPELNNKLFVSIYHFILGSIHVGSLLLLVLIVVMVFAYIIKFGLLLVGRRK